MPRSWLRSSALCTATLLASLLAVPVAAGVSLSQAEIEAFALRRLDDGRTLIDGGHAPIAVREPAGLSCAELYQRRVALLPHSHNHRVPFTDDPRNIGAVFLGTIFTPAFYFLGYSSLESYLHDARRRGPAGEIDALRRASARARCFEP